MAVAEGDKGLLEGGRKPELGKQLRAEDFLSLDGRWAGGGPLLTVRVGTVFDAVGKFLRKFCLELPGVTERVKVNLTPLSELTSLKKQKLNFKTAAAFRLRLPQHQ